MWFSSIKKHCKIILIKWVNLEQVLNTFTLMWLTHIEGFKEHWFGVWRRKHRPHGSGFTSCSWWWEACYWVSNELVAFLFQSFLLFPQNSQTGDIKYTLASFLFMGFSYILKPIFVMLLFCLQSDSQDTHASRGMSALVLKCCVKL